MHTAMRIELDVTKGSHRKRRQTSATTTHQIISKELRPRSGQLRQPLGIDARKRPRGHQIAEQARRRAICARRRRQGIIVRWKHAHTQVTNREELFQI